VRFFYVFLTSVCFILAQNAFSDSGLKLRFDLAERVIVRGHKGSVQYIADKDASDFLVTVSESGQDGALGGEWQFTSKREQKNLILQVESPLSKKDWQEVLSQTGAATPAFHIVIKGPSVPIKINWHTGRIKIKNLSDKAYGSLNEGETEFLNGEGAFKLQQMTGKIKVAQFRGELSIDTYSGDVRMVDVDAKTHIENFIGLTTVTDFKGKLKGIKKSDVKIR
jgi:hypothetical protein